MPNQDQTESQTQREVTRIVPRVAMCCLVLLFLLGCGETPTPGAKPAPTNTASEAAKSTQTSPSGTEADSDVTLRVATVDEYKAVLLKHAGKVIVVDFWATYCVPCRKQFPHTVEMSHKYATDGLATISVCCDEPEKDKEALNFLKKNKATFENLRPTTGGDEETFTAFEIEGGSLPHYKLFDRKGELRYTFGLDPTAEKQFTGEDVEEKVKELLAEKA